MLMRLREIRENKGVSRNQLARTSGISASMIYQIETGRKNPTIRVLKKIADALDVKISELIDEENTLSHV